MVLNVDREIKADMYHAINRLFIVKGYPCVVFADVVVVDCGTLVDLQIITMAPRLGIGEPDNLCGGQSRLAWYM